jgi:hypothetical protein
VDEGLDGGDVDLAGQAEHPAAGGVEQADDAARAGEAVGRGHAASVRPVRVSSHPVVRAGAPRSGDHGAVTFAEMLVEMAAGPPARPARRLAVVAAAVAVAAVSLLARGRR